MYQYFTVNTFDILVTIILRTVPFKNVQGGGSSKVALSEILFTPPSHTFLNGTALTDYSSITNTIIF